LDQTAVTVAGLQQFKVRAALLRIQRALRLHAFLLQIRDLGFVQNPYSDLLWRKGWLFPESYLQLGCGVDLLWSH
jgi:hypothetical protein